MTSSAHFNLDVSQEPIPGYRLMQRIGQGGYGEVWIAEAPGGLTKAVKLVYGQANESQAVAELEALNRIKQVRHPFLLSLERIELVDGRLVIVTELAESSLKDRFLRARSAGLPGIPRDELLGYLRDAAEALDYIREFYSLQHLDIKPENLLLIGGRVKLADFGLVSDLQQSAGALITGLTPMYASPELFSGHASPSSDQYSLAIVFIEMLTGVTPFTGRTSAQLAAQRLESSPDLSMLSSADRAIIARALSKLPEQRFDRCKELIDRLSWVAPGSDTAVEAACGGSGWPAPIVPGGLPDIDAGQPAEMRTIQVSANNFRWQKSVGPLALDDEAAVIVDMPGGELPTEPAPFRPVLFVGLGGTGARVLGALRQRLTERYGGMDRLPAIGMLLVDTVRNGDGLASGAAGLESRQVLLAQLRQTGDYRNSIPGKLNSTARRWNFNVPRSRTTEGFRPLGRLAFIDHLDQFVGKVRTFLAEIMNAESIGVTAARVRQPAGSTAPRVFVVSSLGGGTGSGMFVEAAYAIRSALSRMGLPNHEVYGVSCYWTDRSSTSHDLTIGNACAALREWRHFAHADNQYPGQPECGLPPSTRGQGPFEETYVVHLGEGLNESETQSRLSNVAEYLFRNTLTASTHFFDRCRTARGAARIHAAPRLSTFGIMPAGKVPAWAIHVTADWICESLPRRWRGEHVPLNAVDIPSANSNASAPTPADQAGPLNLANELAGQMGLNFDAIRSHIEAQLTAATGSDPDGFLAATLGRLSAENESQAATPGVARVFDALDEALGARSAAATSGENPIAAALRALHDHQEKQLSEIGKWAARLVDSVEGRLDTGRRALAGLCELLAAIESTATEKLCEPREAMQQWERTAMASPDAMWGRPRSRGGILARKESGLSLDPALCKYFQLRLHELALRETARTAINLRMRLAGLIKQMETLRNELGDMLAERNDTTTRAVPSFADFQAALEYFQLRPEELLTQAELQLEHDFVEGSHVLPRLLSLPQKRRSQLGAALRQASRKLVLRVCQNAEATGFGFRNRHISGGGRTPNAWLTALTPKLLETCGGQRRVLVIKSDDDVQANLAEELSKHVSVPAAVMFEPDDQSTICAEIEQIDPVRVAQLLTGNRREFNELAARLQSRADIDWMELC